MHTNSYNITLASISIIRQYKMHVGDRCDRIKGIEKCLSMKLHLS